MTKLAKRKKSDDQSSKSSKKAKITTNSSNDNEPFPDFLRPTPDECRIVRDDLLALHGFPKEFIKYRRQRSVGHDINIGAEYDDGSDNESCKESVLDGLISTILSQNTTEVNSHKAFASLKSSFPTWDSVLAADAKLVEDAIRCGGLAPTKTSCIKGILSSLFQKKGNLCLEYLRELSIEEIKRELSCFRGIGPKTVACVLMFQLQQDDFPVDTHIFQIAKTLGWVPAVADVKKTYLHLNRRIPDELKFDLNCLIYTHGSMPSYLAYLELFIPMDEALYQKSTSFNLCSTGNNGTDIVCCKTTAHKKKLRIFGFEVNPCLKDSICSRSDRDESINSSETFADEKPEDKTSNWMNSSGTVLPNPNENLRNLSSSAIMELKFECHFCLKKFASSRALGGHQNAHRKERLKKKRIDLEAKRASSMYHLYALIRDNGVTYPYSFLGHQDLSLFVPTIVYGSPFISFSSVYHCQKDTCLPCDTVDAAQGEVQLQNSCFTLIQGGESRGKPVHHAL